MTEYVAWYDWVEQKGLDPNRTCCRYLYYRRTIPVGMAGVTTPRDTAATDCHLVDDEEIQYVYTAEQIAAGMYAQFNLPMDANGSLMRMRIDCEVGSASPSASPSTASGRCMHDLLEGAGPTF